MKLKILLMSLFSMACGSVVEPTIVFSPEPLAGDLIVRQPANDLWVKMSVVGPGRYVMRAAVLTPTFVPRDGTAPYPMNASTAFENQAALTVAPSDFSEDVALIHARSVSAPLFFTVRAEAFERNGTRLMKIAEDEKSFCVRD